MSQRFTDDQLRDFVIPANAQWQTAYRPAKAVPGMTDDGPPGDTVFTVALTDPFSFALSLPSSRGGPLWWDVGIDFDRTTHPDADRALGDAHWVMIPRMVPGQGCCQETAQLMLDLYGSYLAQHFAETERTSDWILLARVS